MNVRMLESWNLGWSNRADISGIHMPDSTFEFPKILVRSASNLEYSLLPHPLLGYILGKTRLCRSHHIRRDITPIDASDPHIGSLDERRPETTERIVELRKDVDELQTRAGVRLSNGGRA